MPFGESVKMMLYASSGNHFAYGRTERPITKLYSIQSTSGRSPMVGVLLVIQVPDASDKGSVTIRFRPIDCFFLSIENAEYVVGMVFDHIILNG
jgi:hypothetical protein